ncbi:hypothetical protein OG689_42470 [Kitasatospora sp. NBC_00240]|uniref:hypothetical protein n=1 Tax=Kitasatospora sp. NBC_00240 TaxID=2903567 RepID=UPI002251B9F1|nr:hypothetical protein [Kitasatospora sp. NBC_00240]MCX5215817.1 hypothetical protein [Kitasatospora sp. NBC_00240]
MYHRFAEPRFLLCREGVFKAKWAYAATLPDVMGLLAQRAPAVQALALTGTCRPRPEQRFRG